MEALDKGIWETTTNRFVAFFDIMGFKDLVLKKSHEDIVILLNSFSENRNELDQFNNSETPYYPMGESKSFTFSDSIIFFTKNDSEQDLNKIIVDCRYILGQAFKYQLPIKGAISFGKITIDLNSSVYFGQPIIDAFLLHEDLHLLSVIADHAFEKRVKELNSMILANYFEFYKTPLKSGKANHNILKFKYPDSTFLDGLKKLYDTVSGKPRQYIDNTIEYIDFLELKKKL